MQSDSIKAEYQFQSLQEQNPRMVIKRKRKIRTHNGIWINTWGSVSRNEMRLGDNTSICRISKLNVTRTGNRLLRDAPINTRFTRYSFVTRVYVARLQNTLTSAISLNCECMRLQFVASVSLSDYLK